MALLPLGAAPPETMALALLLNQMRSAAVVVPWSRAVAAAIVVLYCGAGAVVVCRDGLEALLRLERVVSKSLVYVRGTKPRLASRLHIAARGGRLGDGVPHAALGVLRIRLDGARRRCGALEAPRGARHGRRGEATAAVAVAAAVAAGVADELAAAAAVAAVGHVGRLAGRRVGRREHGTPLFKRALVGLVGAVRLHTQQLLRARCRRRARPVARRAGGHARPRAAVLRAVGAVRLVLGREQRLLALVRRPTHLPVGVRRDARHAWW
eukprot:scaffold61301_cov61-Phaeocystis_antarctica.AAC.5